MSYLFRVDEEWEGKVKRKKHVLVTNPDEIIAYLDSQLDEADDDGEQVYYYITTKDSDNNALDSLLDRTFGKAAQVMEHTGSVKIGYPFKPGQFHDFSDLAQQRIFVAEGETMHRCGVKRLQKGLETPA
jgi:hypothetical protein